MGYKSVRLSHRSSSCILCLIMSPLGIKRAVAFLLIISPWIFFPGVFRDIIFIIAGILLFVSTLDLRKKSIHSDHHQETESKPVTQHIVNA